MGKGGSQQVWEGQERQRVINITQNTFGMYENIIANPLFYIINIHSQKHLKSKKWGLCSFLDALENKTLPGLY